MESRTEGFWDVVIAGAGPAGSTAAQLLARGGRRVLVIEKATFPRFHIGESLLPINLPMFSELGLDLERTAIRKLGAEFLDESTAESKVYPFCDGLPGTASHAYQVDRAAFDRQLIDQSVKHGASVRYKEIVGEVDFTFESVRVCTDKCEYRSRYFVDATGQDALLGRKKRALAPIDGLGKVAEYTHFEDLRPEIERELTDTGNVKVIARDGGWAWVIPLSGARISLGGVTTYSGEGKGLVDRLIDSSPEVQRIVRGASRGRTALSRNFAYRNTRASGSRYVCIGDAGAFIDPVFSSGVALAMVSAERASRTLLQALSSNSEDQELLMAPVLESLHVAYDCFGSMARRFYGTRVMKNLFLAKKPDREMRAGLISVLAGDVWREDNLFQNALLGGRQRFRIAEVTRSPTDH